MGFWGHSPFTGKEIGGYSPPTDCNGSGCSQRLRTGLENVFLVLQATVGGTWGSNRLGTREPLLLGIQGLCGAREDLGDLR